MHAQTRRRDTFPFPWEKIFVTRIRVSWSFVLALCLAGPAGAEQPHATDQAWVAIVRELDRSVILGDLEGMTHARDTARSLLEQTPSGNSRARLRYLLAYANWRLLGRNPAPRDGERDSLADEAESLLKVNLAVNRRDVEAYALLGSIYGMKIGSSMWRGMTLGPRSGKAFDKAQSIDKGNPRFLLLMGMGAYQRPKQFGGGPERAERWLRSALSSFAAQPPNPPWPNWGSLDARIWLGRTLARLGDREAARKEYQKVLAIEPDHVLVRDFLLPGLDR